jgi:hypothetical protein
MLAVAAIGVALGTAWTFSASAQKDDDKDDKKKPKYTIKEVMKKAHAGKDAILTKVKAGKASAEEMKQLVAMYEALEVNKPPRGEEKEWAKRTKALVKAANATAKDEKEAKELLTKATNCKSCHDAHKGEAK